MADGASVAILVMVGTGLCRTCQDVAGGDAHDARDAWGRLTDRKHWGTPSHVPARPRYGPASTRLAALARAEQTVHSEEGCSQRVWTPQGGGAHYVHADRTLGRIGP